VTGQVFVSGGFRPVGVGSGGSGWLSCIVGTCDDRAERR
jgi:hypothetical protein